MDLISIIVPVYNMEKYLHRCINSLLNQTYKNIEILLIDDGSTDNSGVICDKYENDYNNIYVYHKENEGVSIARNFGLQRINRNSKYIGFVDSDDFINPYMYESLYKCFKKFSVDLAVCGIEEVYNDNIKVDGGHFHDNIKIIKPNEYLDNYFNDFCMSTVPWNKLYKRETLKEIRFESYRIYEDQIFIPQVIEKTENIAIISLPLYYYYQRNDSISHGGGNQNGWDDLFYAAENFINFGEKIGHKMFKKNAIERYLGMLITKIKSIEYYKHFEYEKYIKQYRKVYKRYIHEIDNNKSKIIYTLFYIHPKIYYIFEKVKKNEK